MRMSNSNVLLQLAPSLVLIISLINHPAQALDFWPNALAQAEAQTNVSSSPSTLMERDIATIVTPKPSPDEIRTANKANQVENKLDQTGATDVTAFNPIIFIPGDGGSQLEAKLNKTNRVHYVCDMTSDWYDLWLNLHLLVYPLFDCLIDNMKLSYNNLTRTTENTPGVQIRPTNFGSLDSVTYLDIVHLPKTDYFETIAATLEKNHHYMRGVDMVGSPFDFRKAPNELGEFFKNLTDLIERTFVLNNYKPVTLICHSMGCLNSVYLLNGKSQKWKDVYIKRLVCLAAPWDGSFKAIRAMMLGDNLGIPLLNGQKLQELQSTFPSLMYLFPRTPTFKETEILVQTEKRNYTLETLEDLFRDTGMLDQLEMWKDTRKIAASLKAPNVEIWCLYGSGFDTPEKIVFQGDINSTKYTEIQGDGDGTVNLASLRACENFQKFQDKPVYTRQFDKVDHIDILRGYDAANFISDHIVSQDVQPLDDVQS